MPKISVIIPVYDVERYLPSCLDSILNQTFTDWEAICVDDGSPDNCAKILAQYAQKDNRIKAIFQENQGVSSARNKALSIAEGKYICFMDSDDELAPTFLSKMHQLILSEEADAVFCGIQKGTEYIDANEKKINVQSYFSPFEEYLKGKFKTPASVWAKLWKKEVIKSLNFKSEISAGEDLIYLYQALFQTKKVALTSEKLYFYRTRPNSVMTSKLSERFIFGNIKTAELLYEYYKDKKLSMLARKILNQKIAKRIFKFGVQEPYRKDKENLTCYYIKTRPLLKELKKRGIYQPRYLSFKNQIKSCFFLKKGK